MKKPKKKCKHCGKTNCRYLSILDSPKLKKYEKKYGLPPNEV